MHTGGYVLAGGQSSRMGTDKALLPWGGGTVLDAVIRAVREAAGDVVLVAPDERYLAFRGRRISDLRPGQGPLGGIEAALLDTDTDWNLIVACDMPLLSAALLKRLLMDAIALDADCLIPAGADCRHPLAAAYHRRCLIEFSRVLDLGERRVLDATARVRSVDWPLAANDEFQFANANTPEEWEGLRRRAGLKADTRVPGTAEARHADKTRLEPG
jgi:molybdopterin-guanine dinucleotide biosynthesis protein A